MPVQMTAADREQLKKSFIKKFNKATPLRGRLFMAVLGITAAFDPGRVAFIIGVQAQKRLGPGGLEIFRDFAQED